MSVIEFKELRHHAGEIIAPKTKSSEECRKVMISTKQKLNSEH